MTEKPTQSAATLEREHPGLHAEPSVSFALLLGPSELTPPWSHHRLAARHHRPTVPATKA